jgi:NAD(P)H-quinone oxidoreductase subunit 5
MGFMLVQCGLGAWDLALLHLVAHSLYKAHAFCSSGHVVAEVRVASLVPHAKPSLSRVLAAATIASAGLGALAHASVAWLGTTLAPATLALLVFVGVSLAVPLAKVPTRALPVAGVFTLLFAALYFGWHALFAHLWPGAAIGGPAWSLAIVALAGLALLQAVVETRTRGVLHRLASTLARLGAELDARFTHAAFALWPPRMPSARSPETLVQPQEVT